MHPFCTVCDGPAVLLGSLGNRRHLRCRNCGATFSREVRRRPRFPARVLETCTLKRQPDGSLKPEPNF